MASRDVEAYSTHEDARFTFSLSNILSIITSLSAIGVLVVIPYTIGYFLYFDLALMPRFSVIDFYLYFSVPLILGIFFFFAYSFFPMLTPRDVDARELIARRKYIFVILLLIWMSAELYLTVIYVVSSSVFYNTLMLMLLVVFVNTLVYKIPDPAFYILLSLILFINLLALGHNRAIEQFLSERRVEITFVEYAGGQKVESKSGGRLIFAGNGSLSFLDDEDVIFFARTDKNTKIQLGPVRGIFGDCIDRLYFKEIRSLLGRQCARGVF